MRFPLFPDCKSRCHGRTSARRPAVSRRPALEQMEERKLLTFMMINSIKVVEGINGTKTADFTVSLNAPSSQAITAAYRTSDGTANAGPDYASQVGMVTFAPGQKTRALSVPIVDDVVIETTQNFRMTLSQATNATLIQAVGTCTIQDDDTPVTPELTIGDPRLLEGHAGTSQMVFRVSLTAPVLDRSVTVTVRTADGSATAGSDYLARTEVLTFAPGETTKEFIVTILGDTAVEDQEGFFAMLSGANVGIKKANGVGLILNDDLAV